jgi:hypothetical protein
MPTRPYSLAILGGLWPSTSPDSWAEAADAFLKKADDLEQNASRIRQLAGTLPADNAGETIEAMHQRYLHDAMTVMDHSDMYRALSTAAHQIAQSISQARTNLDQIDDAAEKEIEEVKKVAAATHHAGGAVLALAEINRIIAQARAAATAESAATAAEITRQVTLFSAAIPSSGPTSASSPTSAPPTNTDVFGRRSQGHEAGGSTYSDGELQAQPAGNTGVRGNTQTPRSANAAAKATTSRDQNGVQNAGLPAASGDAGQEVRGQSQGTHGAGTSPAAFSPPGGMTAPSGGGGGGSSGMGAGGMPASAFGSAKDVGAPKMGGGAPSGVGAPSPGVGSGMGSGTKGGLPGGGGGAGVPPSSAAGEFTKGLNAGLGGGGGALPPPVTPANPTGTSATETSALSAPVSPASGQTITPASSASAPAPATGGIPMAGGMPMAGGVPTAAPAAAAAGGALPAFNSDAAPRPVTPASGTSAPALPPLAPGAASATSASVGAVPPGVVGPGVGAAAGAGIGMKSAAPDPMLEAATQLVYQLVHASRLYGCLDWCVGVFKTPSGPDFVVVSNEGAGYVPPGVFLPRTARMLFADSALPPEFAARWFGWVNPAQTMVAYAAQRGLRNPNVELYALAVSTDHGGSAGVAANAGVRHYEDCALARSPIAAETPAASLDGNHIHRLEAVDHAEYGRLMRATLPDEQQRSEGWATTRTAVRTALARASVIIGLSVPPVIRQVLTVLDEGATITDAQWHELELARLNATLDSASQRAGRLAETEEISPYARAYHNLARSTELLLLWRDGPKYLEIAYEAEQITKEAALWPVDAAV